MSPDQFKICRDIIKHVGKETIHYIYIHTKSKDISIATLEHAAEIMDIQEKFNEKKLVSKVSADMEISKNKVYRALEIH